MLRLLADLLKQASGPGIWDLGRQAIRLLMRRWISWTKKLHLKFKVMVVLAEFSWIASIKFGSLTHVAGFDLSLLHSPLLDA